MKKILSLLAVAAMAFTACTTDITEDVVKNEAAEYTVPLEFAVEQGETRAFMDDDVTIQFEDGDEIGVYVTPAGEGEATKNAKFTISNKNGVLTAGGQVASFTAGDKLMAYYPYDAVNDSCEATGVYLTNSVVQHQAYADKVNLKNMPMVSVATEMEGNGGTVLFRPAAALIKLNIYTNNEEHIAKNLKVNGAYFYSAKALDEGGSNVVAGRLAGDGFDLTAVNKTDDFTIANTVKPAWDKPYGGSNAEPYFRANSVYVNYIESQPVLGGANAKQSIYFCVFPGSYGGIQKGNSPSFFHIFMNDGTRYVVNVESNYECGRAKIRPFTVDLAKHKYNSKPVTAEYIRNDAAASAEGYGYGMPLAEDLVVICSGSECTNAATDPKVSSYRINVETNSKIAYAQTLDGKYGFRFDFNKSEDNILKRGDKISMVLGGLKFYKVEDANTGTTYFYVNNFVNADNFTKIESGREDLIVSKKKSIAELTDEDIYTEITLKNTEAVAKKTTDKGATVESAAPWTTGFESNYKWNTNGNYWMDQSSVLPSMLQDANNDAILALINPRSGQWRRDGVPQGYGDFRGVIVHESSNVIGDYAKGNIGKYQIRPYGPESFSSIPTAAADATKVIAMWSQTKGSISIGVYKYTCEDPQEKFTTTRRTSGYQEGKANDPILAEGIVAQNKMWATHGELTNGTALFYSSNRQYVNTTIHYVNQNSVESAAFQNYTYPIAITHGVKSKATVYDGNDGNSNSNYTSISFASSTAGFYEWGADGQWTGKTNGFIVEFPGSAATGKTAVSFALAPNHGGKDRKSVFAFPLYWKVEASIDGGTTWTACTNAITGDANGHFDMHQYNFYLNSCGWNNPITNASAKPSNNANVDVKLDLPPVATCAPGGYPQYKFILPESVQGASKVMVKISPRTLDLAWPNNGTSSSWNTPITVAPLEATSTLVHGHMYSFEDVMVTCVK